MGNVCFPSNSRDEGTYAIRNVHEPPGSNEACLGDISKHLSSSMILLTMTTSGLGSPSSAHGSSSISRSFGRCTLNEAGNSPGFSICINTTCGGLPRGSGTNLHGYLGSSCRSGEDSWLNLTSLDVSGVNSVLFKALSEKWAHIADVLQPSFAPSTLISRTIIVGNEAEPFTTHVKGSAGDFFDNSATVAEKGSRPRTNSTSLASSPNVNKDACSGSNAISFPSSSTAWTLQAQANSKSPAASGWNVTFTRFRCLAAMRPSGSSMRMRSALPSEGTLRSCLIVCSGSSPTAKARFRDT
mmetsp:Transcript_2186/g.6088  ORF Transcript_2186/g.6088 Transcript_2186/m.6088 type:complete len:298 (-) Transcript_2186:3108-4001(-)